jgi:hypothetical protein
LSCAMPPNIIMQHARRIHRWYEEEICPRKLGHAASGPDVFGQLELY